MLQLAHHIVDPRRGTHHPRCWAGAFVVGCQGAPAPTRTAPGPYERALRSRSAEVQRIDPKDHWKFAMKKHSDEHHSMRFALLAVGAIIAGVVIADEDLPTITITASRMGRSAVTTDTVGRSASTGAPIERLTLTWSVPFTDLDLSTHGGATELQNRVNARAKAVCQELDRLFPFTDRGGASCIKEAAAGGQAQADKLIAAAERARAPQSSK